MPTPAKTTNEDIVHAARALIEDEGSDFSVAALATRVGIRAPSLYKRFDNRAAILAAVECQVITELGQVIARALNRKSDAPFAAAAKAYRKFAKANPRAYTLLFAADINTGESADSNIDEIQQARTAALAPLLEQLEKMKSVEDPLSAARFVTTLLHGFITMELAGAFHMGGSVDAAFEDAVERMERGLGV